MKKFFSLLLALGLSVSLLPAALGAEPALPMTCEEYEAQYQLLHPGYTHLEGWDEMFSAYRAYLVDAYCAAHPGEVEALSAEELLGLLGLESLEQVMNGWSGMASTEAEALAWLRYRYADKRNAVERVCVEAGAYRGAYPQLWADFDANAYFKETGAGITWSKEGYQRELLIFTEQEFRENMFVQFIASRLREGTGQLLAQPAAPVVPAAPPWITAESYLTFPGDPAYQPGNWDYICALRQQAEQGGLLDYEGRDWAEGSPAQCYETALIRLKCAANYGDNEFEAKAAFLSAGRAFHAAESGWYDQTRTRDEIYYRLSVEKYRAYVLYHPAYSENLGRGLVPALDALGMTLDDFFAAPYMDRVSKEDRAVVETLAAGYQTSYDQEKNRITVEMDGVPLVMDTAPQVQNQRVMVPIRAIAEALGADVEWNEKTWEVTLTRAGTVVTLTPGETAATVDGRQVKMDAAPYADRNRTYVPTRYVSEFFGQAVTWDGEGRRVVISENKTAAEKAYLEDWVLPMGALLGFLEGGDPARFGFYPRPPYVETAYSPNGVNENRTVIPRDRCREILGGDWEIGDREALIEAVEDVLKAGGQKEFKAAADEVKGLSDREIARRTEALSDVDKYMWPYTKALSQKWGKTGIRAWDLCRAAALTRWGYTAGYLTYAEALELLEPAAEELRDGFDSWDQVCENFLEGYYWSLREDLGEKTVWETDLGMAWQYLRNSPDTRTLFDNMVFENGRN